MHRSKLPVGSRARIPTTLRFAAAALALATSQQASAIAYWDEVTLYLTHATYSPGGAAETIFYFGSKPAVELSTFDFTLSWSTPLATPVSSGPGSVAVWMASLDGKGATNYAFADAHTIKGSWAADPLSAPGSYISTSYDNLRWATFRFQTSSALDAPFVVSIELTNIRAASGDVMDLGSGFINWANITPVPEPARWIELLAGLAALGYLRRRVARR